MNDQDYEQVQDRLRFWAAYWVPMLGLDHWAITYKYLREGIHEPMAFSTDTPLMCVRADWHYLAATLDIDMPAMANHLGIGDHHDHLHSEDFAETAFVHELLHCVLAPMSIPDHTDDDNPRAQEYRLKLEELATQMAAKAFMRLKDHLVGQRNLLNSQVVGLLRQWDQTMKAVLMANKDEQIIALACQEHQEMVRRLKEDREGMGYGAFDRDPEG